MRIRKGTGSNTGSGTVAGGDNRVGTGVGIDCTGFGAMSAGTGTRADTGVGNETGTDGCTDFGTGSCINFGACTSVCSITSFSISISPRLSGDSISDSNFKFFGFSAFSFGFFLSAFSSAFSFMRISRRDSSLNPTSQTLQQYFVHTLSSHTLVNGPLWLLLSFVSSEGL
jgi:hypothetical protein